MAIRNLVRQSAGELVRQGAGELVAGSLAGVGGTDSAERNSAALYRVFEFVAAEIDALTPSGVDPVLYAIRAHQPDRDKSTIKEAVKALMGVLKPTLADYLSPAAPHLAAHLLAAEWMKWISDALAHLDAQRICKCELCDCLFYARRSDQKACSLRHAKLLRSKRWLNTAKGRRYYKRQLKDPKKSKRLAKPERQQGTEEP